MLGACARVMLGAAAVGAGGTECWPGCTAVFGAGVGVEVAGVSSTVGAGVGGTGGVTG